MPDPQTMSLLAELGIYAIPLVGVGLESMGIPVPGETALISAAVLASQGHANPILVGVAGATGAILGDNAGYFLGKKYGHDLLQKSFMKRVYAPHRVAKVEKYFTGPHAWLAVSGGRFVPILRIVAGPMAGIHGMPWKRFLVANAGGAIVWAGAITTAGYYAGANAEGLMHKTGVVGIIVASAAAAALIIRELVKHVREHRLRATPRCERPRDVGLTRAVAPAPEPKPRLLAPPRPMSRSIA